MNDRELFRLWYLQPLETLEAMPSGQGGFIALATSCFLYERYAKATLQARGNKADRLGVVIQLANDFKVDEETADIFWEVIRNGLLHEGMPMQKKNRKQLPQFAFHHSYPVMVIENINNVTWLKVQPWKFMHKVLSLWDTNFELLYQSRSFPWANIGSAPV